MRMGRREGGRKGELELNIRSRALSTIGNSRRGEHNVGSSLVERLVDVEHSVRVLGEQA